MGRCKGTNKILNDHGTWLEIDISTTKYPDSVMKIDKMDWAYVTALGYGRVSAIQPNGHNYPYAMCNESLGNGKYKTHLIHRIVLPTADIIDHIDSDGLNNRFDNLRPATNQENARNSRKRKKSSSQLKGVSFHKHRQKWQAQITIDGKQRYLGLFDNELEAHQAYCDVAKKTYGEFFNAG